MRTRNFQAVQDPTELKLWAVRYEFEYEHGEWSSAWFAREMRKEDAEAVASFAAGWMEEKRLLWR